MLYAPTMTKVFVSLYLFVLVCPGVAKASQALVVGAHCIDQSVCKSPEADAFLKELYTRSGLSVEIKYLPLLRDLMEASTLTIDASMSRTQIGVRDYPNLVRVPFPLLRLSWRAASVKPGIKVRTWNDLSQYKVGMLRGERTPYLLAEQTLSEITLYNSRNCGLAMLREGRIDVIVEISLLIEKMAQLMDVEKIYLSEPLIEAYTYHYLNKKHEALAPRLATSLKEMLKDGTSKKLLGKYSSLLPEFPLQPEVLP